MFFVSSRKERQKYAVFQIKTLARGRKTSRIDYKLHYLIDISCHMYKVLDFTRAIL